MKEDDTITTKTTKLNNEIGQHDILSDEDSKTCPVCNSTERFVDNSRAEVCCARCGLVLDENLIAMVLNGEHLTMNKEISVLELEPH